MNEITLYDCTMIKTDVFQQKKNKFNVGHTLHYLPQKRYGEKLDFFVQQLVRRQRSVVKLESEADKPCRLQRILY